MQSEVLSAAQKRKIYAVSRELGYDNDLLHALVLSVASKGHISDLTVQEAIKVIDELEYKKTGRRKPKGAGRGTGLASKKQVEKIYALERELGWQDNPKRLLGFTRKYAKVERIEWLLMWQASNVIEGLKKLVEKEEEEAR